MTDQAITLLEPQGRLDAIGARPMETELAAHITGGRVFLIVDLTGARYISSNGLRVLLVAQKNAQQQGGALVLCGLNPRLREIVEMAGFDRVFEIFETRQAAQAAMNPSNQ
jgi:stage II sporulation protein AA (anti-sigma F factor antagonist)